MDQQLVVLDTPLAGVKIIASNARVDDRGAFSRWFCVQSLAAVLPSNEPIRQINHSLNLRAGTVRGMHFQQPAGAGHMNFLEYKLVRCIRGKVHDVVLDMRPHSATFGQHFALELSETNAQMLLIPPGCAHGFQALEDNSQLLYLHTQDYHAELDAGVRVDDPKFNIQWPLPIQYLSERDKNFPLFHADAESHAR